MISLIRKINPNKATGSDGISGQMLLLCDESVILSLQIIFTNILSTSIYPDMWKLANVTPIFKKGDRQFTINYRPVSLLPICGKILEKIIFNNLFTYLHTILSPKINRVFVQVTTQPTNYYIFLMKSIRHLIVQNPLKLEQYFLTFLKLLTRYGMMD